MRHRSIAAACFTAILLAFAVTPQQAATGVLVRVDKSSQTMSVIVDGDHHYTWRVSTGKHGRGTPSGRFRPQWLSRHHRSSIYGNAPMPFSIFYNGHYAIHGTDQVSRLGRPASHGCIRLHPSNAAVLFSLVQKRGRSVTTIVVH